MWCRYTTGTLKSRRLDSHQHEAVYGTAAFLQERKDLNPVERLWKPPALPGAHR